MPVHESHVGKANRKMKIQPSSRLLSSKGGRQTCSSTGVSSTGWASFQKRLPDATESDPTLSSAGEANALNGGNAKDQRSTATPAENTEQTATVRSDSTCCPHVQLQLRRCNRAAGACLLFLLWLHRTVKQQLVGKHAQMYLCDVDDLRRGDFILLLRSVALARHARATKHEMCMLMPHSTLTAVPTAICF